MKPDYMLSFEHTFKPTTIFLIKCPIRQLWN